MSIWPSASPFLTSVASLRGDEARELRHAHRQPLEAAGEHAEMLPHQQRRRRQQRHLLAGHGGHERRAQRHLGLAEADIAADQPVHRPAGGHVARARPRSRPAGPRSPRRGSGRRTPRRRPCGRSSDRALAQRPLGRDLDQLARQLADALLDLGLARLPADAAQPVELHLLVGMAVAREHVQVLDRHEQLVAAVVDAASGSRAARRRSPASPAPRSGRCHARHGRRDRPRDRARDVLDELVGAPCARALGRCGQPVAQQVVLAQDVDAGRDEAALERQDGDGRARRPAARRPSARPGSGVSKP